jgi:hypothetical protein
VEAQVGRLEGLGATRWTTGKSSEMRCGPQAMRGDIVSATVLHMSEVHELREALHGS